MSSATRDLNNPPDYYYRMNSKQQRNWRRTTRRVQKNEQLRNQLPPFQSSFNIVVFHIHDLTTSSEIDQLILKAKQTELYIVDTESQISKYGNEGALIQIQMIHSPWDSTTILIEVHYLPVRDSQLFTQITELWTTIFNNGHTILSWGSLETEFESFQRFSFIKISEYINSINLPSRFRLWHESKVTHPRVEMRENMNSDDRYFNRNYCCDHPSHYDLNASWSLQDAIAQTFNKFLDKTETINHWSCGIDLLLNTWTEPLFSNKHHDVEIEQSKRLKMQCYAINDCAAVAELFIYMYPNEASIILETATTATPVTTTRTIPRTTTSSIPTSIMYNHEYRMSIISEDELIEALKPHLDETPTNRPTNTTEPSTAHKTEHEQQVLKKRERQRRKNAKLKWKQQHRSDFQHKTKRPIYYKYDYRKIRAQLKDDQICNSHQITINRNKAEVLIGFRSLREKENAVVKMPINYFSKEQYRQRWGYKI